MLEAVVFVVAVCFAMVFMVTCRNGCVGGGHGGRCRFMEKPDII